MRIIKHYKLPILTGFLIGTSYIPFPPWAVLFALIPLWRFQLEKATSWKDATLAGWISGFILTLIGFNWVTYTIHEFGHFPWPVAFIGFLFFAAISNLDLALSGLTWWVVSKKLNLKKAESMALIVLLTALFKTYVPTIFNWNYGYTLFWANIPAYHLSELIGFQGLSYLIIIFNLVLWLKRFKLAVAILVVLNLSSLGIKKSLTEPDQEAHFTIIQANIGNFEKIAAEKGWGVHRHIIDRYISLSEKAIEAHPETQFIVWPETAFPALIYKERGDDHYLIRLKEFVKKNKITLLTGGYGHGFTDHKISNSFFVIEPDGSLRASPYSKTHLLAFGEYIPMADIFPKLKEWIPAGDFGHGNGPKVETFGDLNLGPQICYESLFPDFSVGLSNLGAQVIVNLTNDSWYGTWQEPYQHLYMTLARGVELRRPVVRATNTGISTVSLADGSVLDKSPLSQEWMGHFTVPFYSNAQATIYQKYPWLMDLILLTLTFLLVGRARFARNS
jgi:apolipoprotein N-acyltransferase